MATTGGFAGVISAGAYRSSTWLLCRSDYEITGNSIDGEVLVQRPLGFQVAMPAANLSAAQADRHHAAGHSPGRLQVQADIGFSRLDTQRRIEVSEIRYSDFAYRIPELAEGLRFSRREKGEVRLIVGVDAGHQFDVGPISSVRLRSHA